MVLKRLDDARRDGDNILAVIRGSAVNNDGSDKVGFTAPSLGGQRNVILESLAFADVDADSISYVETHGTGTPLGDPIEIAALTEAYRMHTQRRGYCAIGSVKPNVGHMETAAGVAGLIKAVMALQHRMLPPSLNYTRPNPEIDFADSPFFVNTELRPWTSDGGPRRAGLSSFGVGGTNAHVILEEYLEPETARPSRAYQLLVWSAKTEGALEMMTSRLAEQLQTHREQDLADVAFTLQCGRERFSRRRILVCDSREGALSALSEPASLPAAVSGSQSEAEVAFLFPGQGAQHLEMAAALYRREAKFRESLETCARLLEPELGLDLCALLYSSEGESGQAQLNETWLTQPALFAVEYALARQWQAWGIEPTAMLGHSIGEYVAACLAGVFTLEDALRLVARRGRLMQGLPPGAMLAVPLAEEELSDLDVMGWDLAAVNGPRSCVLSGPVPVIEAVREQLLSRGLEARVLQTSHAFHSAMMDPILEAYGEAVAKTQRSAPKRRFLSNVSGNWIAAAEATSVDYWVRHLRGTVRFHAGLERLLDESEAVLLEVGPGQTLSTLARQLPAERKRPVIASLPHPRAGGDEQASMLTALGRLWQSDVQVDWSLLHAGEDRRRVSLPTYPYERRRYWIDPPAGGGARRSAGGERAVLP
ncbi:type I polyketide synthase, partial [Microbulbifer halophilus]|uniref:type I polyketide synthase n=1 Tax=Microbulbifer halophilus TaxID=453963 RepID=UPI0036267F8B